MKRLVRNGLFLLVIIAVGFLAFNYYTPKEAPIHGVTTTERLEEIRERVDKLDYISVPAAQRREVRGQVFVRYVVQFNAPLKLFEEVPQRQQGFSGVQTQTELQDAVLSYLAGIAELLRLTLNYIVPVDPMLRGVLVEVHFPDGGVARGVSTIEELRSVPERAADNVWYEKLHFLEMDMIPREG